MFKNLAYAKKTYRWPKAHEKMFNILIIKKVQIKTTMKYYLTSVSMAIIKKIKNVGEDVEKRQILYTVGDVNWWRSNGKQYGSFSKS